MIGPGVRCCLACPEESALAVRYAPGRRMPVSIWEPPGYPAMDARVTGPLAAECPVRAGRAIPRAMSGQGRTTGPGPERGRATDRDFVSIRTIAQIVSFIGISEKCEQCSRDRWKPGPGLDPDRRRLRPSAAGAA